MGLTFRWAEYLHRLALLRCSLKYKGLTILTSTYTCFYARIQLNHPYTHKRHRFLPARASRTEVGSSCNEFRNASADWFRRNDSENPRQYWSLFLSLGVKGPSTQRAPEQTPRGRSSCRIFCANSRTRELERSWKSKCAASRECSNTCCSVPSKYNTRIICRRACSAKFIHGLRIGVGVFEPPPERYRRRIGTCGRYTFMRLYAGQRSRLRRMPLFHVWDTPSRFGRLSIVIDTYTFMTWL